MAQDLGVPKPTCHARSISLPSSPHPLAAIVEDHFQRLKASSEAASSSSASSICHNLCELKDLYESVNDFLQLPLTHQSLSQEQHSKWAEQVLDGSLSLLDVCGSTRDILAEIKESVQEIQSSLRRRRTNRESIPANDVGAYMNSRKKINKMVSKCTLNLKRSEKLCSMELSDKDSSLIPIMDMFRGVEVASISVLKSLLSYASGAKATSKQSGWKLVSKIMQKKHATCDTEEKADGNEVEKMDSALYALSAHKLSTKKAMFAQNALKQLGTVDMALQELEEGLESTFRCLLKTRVNLLNALSQ